MKNTLTVKIFAVLAVISLIMVALAPVIFGLAPSLVEAPQLDENENQIIENASDSIPVPVEIETE
ncbi:MAG: hypothetical protein P1V18_04340 [Candidatus Gracilibacteria bacterium]|nr:hypothetical protein [Candidatus Gracilibacteria bacterium]